jgi:hypothetical protein
MKGMLHCLHTVQTENWLEEIHIFTTRALSLILDQVVEQSGLVPYEYWDNYNLPVTH